MPIGNASAEPVVVKYPSEGGGSSESDTWELYVGADKLIDEFIFRRGGARKPSVVTATGNTRKLAHSSSRPITAGRRTKSPCEFPFRMCRSK